MKKLALLTVLSLGIGLGFENLGLAQERYVRKPLPQPDFFVPQKDVEYQEKLPPFYVPEVLPQADTEEKDTTKSIEFQPQQQKLTQPTPEPEFNPNLDINLDSSAPVTKEEETPKYKQEYEAYLKDLNVIAQTGKAPHNSDLEADLSTMSDDIRLEVSEEGKISPHSSNEELINPMAFAQVLPTQAPLNVNTEAQIIDKVEVINIPEDLSTNTKTSSMDKAPEEYKNPFAQAEEIKSFEKSGITVENLSNESAPTPLTVTTPEVAAHFRGGSNPFAPQSTNEPTEVNTPSVTDHISEELPEETSLPQEPQEAQEPQETPENHISDTSIIEQQSDEEPKISRSMGRRSKSSSNSSGAAIGSGASFGLGPNMVR